jgi:3-dehydroquinate synthase
VDAAIGGKTGVNFEKYKNILGVIRQPEFTYLCPQVLESLPQRDFLSGEAEVLKTFIIEDDGNYEKAVSLFSSMNMECCEDVDRGMEPADAWPEIVAAHSAELTELIFAAASVKAGIVSRDQFEKGERRKLNLGHTFAHAIETLAQRKGYDITHGEAVSMGILMAAELADAYEMRNPEDGLARRLDEAFLSCGLPIGCPFRVSAMAEVMRKDKKASAGLVHFVLPFEVGDVRVVDFSVEDVVRLLSVK